MAEDGIGWQMMKVSGVHPKVQSDWIFAGGDDS